jgi:hypothetical protein
MYSSSSTTMCANPWNGDTTRPPIASLLKTNKPPIASDVSAIHRAISKTEFDISNLDCQISQAVANLNDLRHKRAQDERQLKTLKGIMHPIRRTPPELLAAIFVLTLPRQWQLWSSSILGSESSWYRKAVLLPGRVCRLWRDISLTTPRLWSNISITLKGESCEAEVNLVDTWLSRTGQLPLSIEIYVQKNEVIFKHSIPSALIASCARWRYLQLSCSSSWLRSGVLDGVRNRLSSLQVLVGEAMGSLDWCTQTTDLFEDAPQIRCYRFRYGTLISPSSLRWAQLTDLSINEGVLWQCYQILSLAQNLITCSLSATVGSLAFPLPRLCHPHLRSISIEQSSNYGNIQDYLILPALSKLQYTTKWSFDPTQSTLVAFLSRSACSLKRLVLDVFPIATADDYVVQILRLTPSLSELQLIRQATDQLLSRLTHRPSDSDQLVPSLHTIELTFANGKKPLPAGLADMIESRWNVGDAGGDSAQDKVTNIKCVRVFLERSRYETYNWEPCMRLQRLRDEGLDICFTVAI